jgi:ubiquinone/menaquinone biosynthesis C-methylase UbiE
MGEESKIYLKELENLKKFADSIPNTRMMSLAKITTMVMLNMRYERISINHSLETHPYILVKDLIYDAQKVLSGMHEVSFIENASKESFLIEDIPLENGHNKLFQKLWVNFSEEDYKERIERYIYRLRINGLSDGWVKGFKCVDFGCGHGNFAHALLNAGADCVYGIDFGKNSIEYAVKARDRMGIKPNEIEFKLESVYNVSKEDETFDFAIQNGVFHHLEDEDAAYKEVWRVLKPGGWFWVYTDGAGSIKNDLWDASKHILKATPYDFIISYLEYLNIETGKKYHLGDGLNAIYRFTTWDEITARLSDIGFGNFRRLVGGFSTDYDHDVIAKDKFGKEKFGEGNLRILAQKMS